MTLYKLEKYSAWGPLVLRVVAGLIFLLAGFGKVTGIEGVTGFFTSLGFPAAGALAWIVGLVELIGGAMLILGVLVRWAAIPLGAVMLVSLFTARWGSWIGTGRLDLMLLAVMVALVFMGAGKWALYADCKPKRRK